MNTSVKKFRKVLGYRHFIRHQTLVPRETIFRYETISPFRWISILVATFHISKNRTVHLEIDVTKHQMSIDIWSTNISKKRLHAQENTFIQNKKKILRNIIIITFKVPLKLFSWAFRTTKISNCMISFPVPFNQPLKHFHQ